MSEACQAQVELTRDPEDKDPHRKKQQKSKPNSGEDKKKEES